MSFLVKLVISPLLIIFIILNESKASQFCSHLDQSLEILELILEQCEKHHVSDVECDRIFTEWGEKPSSEVKGYFHNLSVQKTKGYKAESQDGVFDSHANESHLSNSNSSNANTNTNKVYDYSSVSHSPQKAFAQLTEWVTQRNTKKDGAEVELPHKLDKSFRSLIHPADMKSAFEVVDKILNAKNSKELTEQLKTRNIEPLVQKRERTECKGQDVWSVRLSIASRLCFDYISKDPLKIKILCIGQGDTCYPH